MTLNAAVRSPRARLAVTLASNSAAAVTLSLIRSPLATVAGGAAQSLQLAPLSCDTWNCAEASPEIDTGTAWVSPVRTTALDSTATAGSTPVRGWNGEFAVAMTMPLPGVEPLPTARVARIASLSTSMTYTTLSTSTSLPT